MFPDILALRNPASYILAYQAHAGNSADALGASQTDYSSLFLPGEEEIDFRHLNKDGNNILGEIFASELIEKRLLEKNDGRF